MLICGARLHSARLPRAPRHVSCQMLGLVHDGVADITACSTSLTDLQESHLLQPVSTVDVNSMNSVPTRW